MSTLREHHPPSAFRDPGRVTSAELGFGLTPRQRELRATILIALVGCWVAVPRLLQSLTAPKFRNAVGVAEQPYSAIASLALLGLTFAVIGFAALIILESLSNPPRSRYVAVAALLAPWLFLTVRDWTLGASFHLRDLIYPLFAIALWMLRPSVRQFRTVGWVVAAVVVVSIVLAIVLPSKGIFRDVSGQVISEDKELLPIGILIGIFTHGNNLGQFLVLGVPALTALRRRWAVITVLLAVLAVLWCASRSSIVALAVVGLAVAVVAPWPRSRRGVPAVLVVVALFSVDVVLPLVTTDPLAFTNRGLIWGFSLEAWRTHPIVGLGSGWYEQVAESSGRLASTVFHGHNQFVQLLVTGGLVLVGLVAWLLIVALAGAVRLARNGRLIGVAFLAALAGASLLEVSFVFVDNTSLFPAMVVPLALLLFAEVGTEAAGQTGSGDRVVDG